MDAETLKKRRMRRLNDLATKSEGRHDAKLPLSEIATTLDITAFAGGFRFVDKDNSVYEGGSDQAYDFTTLYEEGLIEHTYLHHERDSLGGVTNKNPAVMVTPAGFQAVSDARKSWLTRSIEKQPMTFVQIIVTIIIALVSGLGGWAIGRYVTPASNCPPTSAPTEDAKEQNE